MNPQKQVDGRTLIPDVIQAVLGSKALKHATRPLGQDESESLSRALKMDVDQWRQEFGEQLRATGSALIADLHRRKDELKAGEIAYSLAVCVDKAAALEGRSQLNASSVNIQVNNFGPASKDSLLDQLSGALVRTSQHHMERIEPTVSVSAATPNA